MHTIKTKEANVTLLIPETLREDGREERRQRGKFHNDKMSPQWEGIILNLHITNNRVK